MEKSLDRKLARIPADPACNEFILADAKDADMAFGLAAPGCSPEHHVRRLPDALGGQKYGARADLARLGIRPYRPLEAGLQLTQTATAYGSSAVGSSVRGPRSTPASGTPATGWQPEPDSSRMSQAEKVQRNLERWRRVLG